MILKIRKDYKNYIETEKKLKKNSVDAYVRDLESFNDYINSLSIPSINEINNTHIIRYLLNLQRDGKSTSTISRHLASIRCLFEYLLNKSIIKEDPTLNLRPPRKEKKSPIILTEDEVNKLLDLPDISTQKGSRDKALLEVLYASGLRVSEINSLNIEDIDLKQGTIKLYQEDSFREVPMGRVALDSLSNYLKNYRKDSLKDEPLFINYSGERLTRQGLWKIIKGYAKDLSLKKSITPQVLRNSFAVHLLRNGADIKTVQGILGHSDVASTQVYTFLAEDTNLREVYNNTHPRA